MVQRLKTAAGVRFSGSREELISLCGEAGPALEAADAEAERCFLALEGRDQRIERLEHALRLAEGRIAMLMRAELPESDHPTATEYVLGQVRSALAHPTVNASPGVGGGERPELPSADVSSHARGEGGASTPVETRPPCEDCGLDWCGATCGRWPTGAVDA